MRDIRLRKNFRASSSNRTFAGHSLGGLLGAYALFKHPDMFDNYILGSPSVWYNDNEILQSATIKPSQKIKVYLSVGNLEKPSFGEIQDMVAGAESLAKKINENKGENITLKLQIIEGPDIQLHSRLPWYRDWTGFMGIISQMFKLKNEKFWKILIFFYRSSRSIEKIINYI